LLIICLFWAAFGTSTFAQIDPESPSDEAMYYYQEGMRHLDAKRTKDAIQAFVEALKYDKRFAEAHLQMAFINEELGLYDQSALFYKNTYVIKGKKYPSAYLLAAESNMILTNYSLARKQLEMMLELTVVNGKLREKAEETLRNAKFGEKAILTPVPFDPKNLGKGVNTEYDEYLPTVTADETNLIITRKEPRPVRGRTRMREDFYSSNKTEAGWQKAENIGPPINTDGNEGAQCLSPDGQILFYTGCNLPAGVGDCDLYMARWEGESWSKPKNLGNPVNSTSWDSQPSLSSDGKTLYFTSTRKGGKGGQDIWRTVMRENGSWSIPENLDINTDGHEISPFIHPDDNTLYFASTGHPGMGEMDIFYVRREADGKFKNPINIGYPINTAEHESSLIVSASGNTAYFASDMEGGYGMMDIYGFDLYEDARPTSVSYTSGKVFDKETKAELAANFELLDLSTGEVVVRSTSDPKTGEFLVCLPSGKEYGLNVSKDGYLFYSEHFSITEAALKEPVFLKVPLQPIKVGGKVVMKNIFFATGKYDLKPASLAELGKLVAFLNTNSSVGIEISGHTDNVGGAELNQKLSTNRAKSVYNHLIEKGIDASRLTYKGYGASTPIASNDDEAGRAQNRRTEFKVVSK